MKKIKLSDALQNSLDTLQQARLLWDEIEKKSPKSALREEEILIETKEIIKSLKSQMQEFDKL